MAKNGALIEVRGNEVGGHADDFNSLVVGLAVGRRTRKSRQERGVDVEDSILPVPNEVGRQNFHKASQDDEIHRGFFQMGLEGGFGFLAIPIVNMGKRQLEAAGKGSELRVISCQKDWLCPQATRFPRAQNRFGRMGFFGNKNGQTTARA